MKLYTPVVFILSRTAMQISKSSFQEAKKVSKGVDHQHTLRP